jgi:hypothetical protein
LHRGHEGLTAGGSALSVARGRATAKIEEAENATLCATLKTENAASA